MPRSFQSAYAGAPLVAACLLSSCMRYGYEPLDDDGLGRDGAGGSLGTGGSIGFAGADGSGGSATDASGTDATGSGGTTASSTAASTDAAGGAFGTGGATSTDTGGNGAPAGTQDYVASFATDLEGFGVTGSNGPSLTWNGAVGIPNSAPWNSMRPAAASCKFATRRHRAT